MTMLKHLWNDENGFVTTTDTIVLCAILVIGVLVGIVTLRDQVVQELGDLSVAIGSLNQSYSFASATVGGFSVAGSLFIDNSDECEAGTEEGDAGNDPVGSAPGCIDIGLPASAEG